MREILVTIPDAKPLDRVRPEGERLETHPLWKTYKAEPAPGAHGEQSALTAMERSTATWWLEVDSALLQIARGASYHQIYWIAPWGGAWGEYGWTALVTFGWPGRTCLTYVNSWGHDTQEGWNTTGC